MGSNDLDPQFSDLGAWIRHKFGKEGQGGLAAKLKPKVSKNAVSMWNTGKNRISPEYQKQIRVLGYDGPFPESVGEITRADLNALGDDLKKIVEGSSADLKKDIQALGAAIQKVLIHLGVVQ